MNPTGKKIEKLPDLKSVDIVYMQPAIIYLADKINEIIEVLNTKGETK